MRRLTVDLADDAFSTLATIARRERRPIRDQAAVLIERALNDRRPADADELPAPPAAVPEVAR